MSEVRQAKIGQYYDSGSWGLKRAVEKMGKLNGLCDQ